VDLARGVHDALERDASQRPAAEREVEPFPWEVERFRVVHGESDAAALLVGEHRARGRDVLGARVERVKGRGVRGRERGEEALSAADVEDTFALEWNDVRDRGSFDPGFVASLHRLRLRLVRLEGGAAGAELGRLCACVFELGAGVGVDELSGFDLLEAVPF